MVTPFAPDGSVDLQAAVALAEHLVANGHDGLVLNGTTGESPTTHAPEKAELVRAVVDAVGDRAMIVAGAGSNDTDHAVRMARQAAEAGAHGLLVVTPYYSRPSQDGIVRHTVAVADATDLPVMLYDVPGRTGVRLASATYERLAEHENIVAVKDATGDVFSAARTMARTDLDWYSGDDALFLAFLAHGAAGLVSVIGHVAGQQLRDIGDAFRSGQVGSQPKVLASRARDRRDHVGWARGRHGQGGAAGARPHPVRRPAPAPGGGDRIRGRQRPRCARRGRSALCGVAHRLRRVVGVTGAERCSP